MVAIENHTVATLFTGKANVAAKPIVGERLFTFEFVKFYGKVEIRNFQNEKNKIKYFGIPLRIRNIFGVDSFSTTRSSNLSFPLHLAGM